MWFEFLRWCRTIHSWLGVIVLPWVIIIAFTGFYINHPDGFHRLFGYQELSNAELGNVQPTQVNGQVISTIVAANWPEEQVLSQGQTRYRGRPAFAITKPSGTILIPLPATAVFFVRTGLSEKIVTMDGTVLRDQVPYPQIFRTLHEQGWLSSTFGTFFADVVAISMILFAASGLFMWSVPKVRRLRATSTQDKLNSLRTKIVHLRSKLSSLRGS